MLRVCDAGELYIDNVCRANTSRQLVPNGLSSLTCLANDRAIWLDAGLSSESVAEPTAAL